MPWSSGARRSSVFSGGQVGSPIFGGGASPLGGGGFSGGSSGGTTQVGAADAQYNEFLTGPFIKPPLGAATTGTSSLQRAFPERIGGNLLGTPNGEPSALDTAMQVPARIGAQPVAIADTIMGGGLGRAAKDIGDNSPLGAILGFAGGAIERVFSLPAAIMNSDPSLVMAKLWNKGDDTPITPELLMKNGLNPTLASGFKKNGLPILGWAGITGDQMTVGELKKELEGRGFLNSEDPTGNPLTWEQFAAQVTGDPLGSFKQGHAAVNENGVADFMIQSAGQMLELAPLGGALGLATRGIGGAASMAAVKLGLRSVKAAEDFDAAAAGIGKVAALAGKTEPAMGFTIKNGARVLGQTGDNAAIEMAENGIINEAASGLREGVAELASGSAKGATMKAWAVHAGNAIRSALYPNIPKLNPLQRYLVGQTGVRTALIGGEAGTSLVEDQFGTDVPLISNLHDFFKAVNNDTIMSDDAVFATVMAFQYPVRAAIKQTAKPVTGPTGRFLGLARDHTYERALAGLEKELGKGAVAKLGGPEEAARWMDRIAQDIAFEKMNKALPEGVKMQWESIPEAGLRMKTIHNTIRASAEFLIRTGRIAPSDLVRRFREVHERPTFTTVREDGTIFHTSLPYQTRLSPETIIKRANAYVAASKGITDPVLGMQTMVLGRAPVMAKEDLEFAIQQLREHQLNGQVDAQFIRDLFYETPGLLDDPFVSEGTHNFFIEAMNPARNEKYDAQAVIEKLSEYNPPTRDQLWHNLYERDRKAPTEPVSGDNGVVTNGVARNIHSEDTAKRFVQSADARVRELNKQRGQLMEHYRSLFSKRGRIKPSVSDHNWTGAAQANFNDMAIREVGHYSATSGKARDYKRGFDVAAERLGVVPEGDVDGMVAAARAVRMEYPGADVRFTPSVDRPGHLDVTGSYHFATEANARAKAAEIGADAIYNSANPITPMVPPHPIIPVPKAVMDDKITEILTALPGLPPEHAEAVGEIIRTMAQNHVRYNGGSPIDYINNMEFVKGGRRGAGALLQQDLDMTDKWASIMESAGHGPSSKFRTTMDTTGRQFEVPTGNKPYSLDDAWRVKMQGLNPSKMADADVIDLYRRTFKAHTGDLTDPVDNFRRFAFSMLSPGNNLTSNEIGFAALGVRTFADIQRIAKMTDDQIVRTIMDVNAGFKSVGAQARGVRDLARKLVEDPSLLNIRPGELPADYITRVASHSGLNMKTANFAAMLSDPMTWPIGTVDVHVARSLLSGDLAQYLKPEDWPPGLREKYLRTAKTTVTRSGEEVVTYNQPGPKGKNTFTGSDYEKFNDMLRLAIERKYGTLPFGTAGAQWMHWDEVRGRYEPHTSVWPGTENLPKNEAEVYLQAKAEHVNSEYLNRHFEGVMPLRESARFFQKGAEGQTKGSIEWDARSKAIIRLYTKGDVSTLVHELGHQIRQELHPTHRAIAENYYGVKEGRWTVKHEERFARDFERYLRDGRAPTDALRDVFSKIATWMRDIYASIKGTPLEAQVAPEIRQLFDRALGKVDEPARIELPPDVVAYTRAHGGGTFNPRTGKFHEHGGYGVGVVNGTFRKVDPNDAAAVKAAIDEVVKKYPNAQVGTWLDDQGVLHVDPSEVVADGNTAMALAAKRKQEAIWDFDRGQEIKTGDPVPPSERPAGPLVFQREDEALLLEREAMREQVRALDSQIGQTKTDIRAVRARAKELKGGMNNLDESFNNLNPDGTPRVSGADLKMLTDYTNWVRENYPMFDIEAGPHIMNLYKPDSNLVKNLMLENDATGQYLFNWGPLSRMQHAIQSAVDAAIRPVRGRIESRDTTSRIYEVLMGLGAKKDEVDRFLSNINDVLLNERTIGLAHEQIPITRGMNAMGARQLTQQAISAMHGNDVFMANFEKRYGGKGFERMYVPISEAYNPVVRAIQRKIEAGGKVNRALRLIDSAYDAYHTQPGFASMAVATHAIAKWFYPLVRFTANPLYHVYNSTEADIIAVTQDGLRVRRGRTPTSAEVFNVLERGNTEAYAGLAHQRRRMEAMGLDPQLDAYTDELIRNATLDQTGVTMGYNSRRAAIMERQVDLRRPETIKDAIAQFVAEDPAMAAARKRYGGDVNDWVDGLTQDIFGIDKSGAKKYIGDLITEQGWTHEEYRAMQPLINEVTNRMQKSFDDIYEMHVGNVNRSRIERVINSYWLFWPASYMLKANRWMFKVLTEGAFGKQSNLGGAWTLQQLSNLYRQRYTTDDNFRQLVDDNKDLEFMLSAILPVAPWSDGVSLNRFTRYLGGDIGLWPQYTNFDLTDFSAWSAKMADIGPVYSFGLAGDVSKNLAKDLNWEGGPLGFLSNTAQETPQNPVSVPGL